MEPQEQSFCETVLEEGVIADDTGSDEAHQEIVKAAQASENQDDDDSKQHIRDNKGQQRGKGSNEGPILETLDYTIRIGSTPTFLYFDL